MFIMSHLKLFALTETLMNSFPGKTKTRKTHPWQLPLYHLVNLGAIRYSCQLTVWKFLTIRWGIQVPVIILPKVVSFFLFLLYSVLIVFAFVLCWETFFLIQSRLPLVYHMKVMGMRHISMLPIMITVEGFLGQHWIVVVALDLAAITLVIDITDAYHVT